MDTSRQLADQGSRVGMRMLQHINQALGAVDPQLVASRVRDAMEDGEELGRIIDDVLSSSGENSALREKAEIADECMILSMTEGGVAMTSSESDVKEHIQSMKKYADEVMVNLNAASLLAGR